MNVAINGPEILGYLFGNTSLPITETMRNSWIIMAFILFLCIFLTRRMEKIPKGKQALAEKAVLMIDGLVDSTMGEGCGNMAGGLVITTLIMGALKVLSNAVLGFLPVPLLQIGLPGVLSLYFDCFTACMQAFIFSMLTMAYVGDARGS